MDDTTRDRVRVRSVALWSAATTALAGIGLVSLPRLSEAPVLVATDPVSDAAFVDVLVTCCAAAALVAAAWLWFITTDVVVRVVAAGGAVAVRRPGPVRMLLLAACGAVVLGTATPAVADDRRPVVPQSLAGLPLPDRATSDGPPDRRADAAPRSAVRVRAGDSLWAIAEQRLGPRATVVDLVDDWHRIYDRNTDVIGPDPDLILPGQLLELPPID